MAAIANLSDPATTPLSPDGSRVVHDGPVISEPSNGLYITDLVSGETTLLPGTARGDSTPLWSPDGNQIAFTRGPSSGLIGAPGAYNIVVVNVDGSNSRQLTNGSNANHALAWLPDGNRILYSAVNQGSAVLQTIDVRTGEVERLSDVSGDGALSPDLKRLVFPDLLPLDKYGLSVSNLDGSNHRILADGNPYIATDPVWSPDGKWVLVSVDNSSASESRLMLALIQVDTCQIIALPNLSGYTYSWLP